MKITHVLFLLFSNFVITKQQSCWTPYPSSQSYGGSSVGQVASLEICKEICQARSDCQAVEWVTTGGDNCFLFQSSTPPSYPNRAGIDHYVSLCNCSWVEYPGKRNFGGVLQSGVTTLDACKNACTYSVTCEAIEFVAGQSQCFHFTSGDEPTSDASGISHFRFVCNLRGGIGPTSPASVTGGVCTWTSQSGTGTKNGIFQAGVQTLDDCKKACTSANCKLGFDWNTNNQCFLSTTSDTYSSNAVTHYSSNCGGNVLSWSVAVNTNSPGGSVVPTAQTLDDCKAACTNSGPCTYGIDWDKNKPMGQRCWISSQMQLTNFFGVDHHSPVLGLGSTLNPGYVSNCTWSSYNNSNSPLGAPKPNVTTLADCQKACIDAKCIGIDWDPLGPVKCWHSQITLVIIGGYLGVTHYNYTCPGASSTTTTAPSLVTKLDSGCDYVLYVNSGSDGGTLTSYQSNKECRNQCTVQGNCKAYEWRFVSASQYQCYLYSTDAAPKYSGTQIGSSYYIFRKCT